jgi:2-hydroxy-3-oxopropionate reductase
MRKLGFIGLGIMGKPMAKNLLKAGYSLIVYDVVTEAVAELVEAGAGQGVSCKDVASKSDVIITMLPNSPDVQKVVCGLYGVLEGAKPGTILIDMSSIAPLASKEISKACVKKGVIMLDAPVSGGEPKAIEGTLAIMVGGPEDTFNNVKDILSNMGTSVILVGDIGAGNITKLANQIIVAGNLAAMSEAMVLATKAGVDPEKVFNAIKGGLAGSAVLNAKMPLILKGNFNPGFRINLHVKDLKNVLDTAGNFDVPIPITEMILEIMQKLQDYNLGGCDHGGLIQHYEKQAKVKVRVPSES